nr:ubiquitin hydrolase [Tanacetum cinerariifolium]
MAYTSSSSSNLDTKVSTCSKSCLKSYKTLKEHYDNLPKDFSKSQFNLGAYKAGLESVEARLEVYKKNEVVFEDDIKILKLDVMLKDKAITELRQKFKKAKKERDDLKLTLKKFKGYDSQGVDSQVLENQVNDKYNSSKGYHAVPPPYAGNFMPHKPNLVFVDEHVVSESVTSLPSIAKSKVKTSESKLKNISDPLIEEWVSDDKEEDVSQPEIEKKTTKPSFVKINFVKANKTYKIARKTVEQVKHNMRNRHSPRGNQRNWNNMTSQRLGNNFEMFNKACYVCGCFEHLKYDYDYHQTQFNNQRMEKPVLNNERRVNHQNSRRITHPNPKRNMVPRTVLTKSGLILLNTAQTKRTANGAIPMPYFSKKHIHLLRGPKIRK